MTKKPLIISTDPGIDDIAAITISLFSKDLDVKMIVPTWGNVALEYTLQNTLNLEKFLHTEVPVAEGANQPLVAPKISAASVHGKTGVAGFDFEEATNELVVPGLAATLMYNEIMDSPEKVTLLGIGPLTDFALLLKQYPNVVENIEEIVIMGANIGRGNHSPLAEYNIAGDPEAAQVVFQSGLPIKVAPLEIGNKTHITPEEMREIDKSGEVGHMLYSLFSNIHEPDGDPRIKIFDPTAVGLILCPEVFTIRDANVQIETSGKYTYGASVIDFMAEEVNAQVATDVDVDSFANWFIDGVRKADQGRQ
ncbi:MAG: nucleoside hydrolase [Lactobacillus sp.]|nr:nucleoside hydrolase [Lactobacillus sp.]